MQLVDILLKFACVRVIWDDVTSERLLAISLLIEIILDQQQKKDS